MSTGSIQRQDIEASRRRVRLPRAQVELSLVSLGPEEGDCALFVHGGAGHLMQWQHQLCYFGQHLKVYAYDMRGHGESDAPATDYTLEEAVADLEELVEVLELPEKFHLLCHSYGGAVGAEFARRHGSRLKSLVLLATAGTIPLAYTMRALLKLPAFALAGIQKVVKNAVSTPPAVLKRLVPNLVLWDGWHIYPEIEVPSLVVCGELDLLTRPRAMRQMAELLPECQFETIRFAGHLPQLERPDRCNRLLERFLFSRDRGGWRGSLEAAEP